MTNPPSPFGSVLLVTGPEEFLNDRAVREARAAARRADADVAESDVAGEGVTPAVLAELTAPTLFAASRLVVLRRVEELPDDAAEAVLAAAAAPEDDVALVLVHSGGAKGTGLLAKLRKLPGVREERSEKVQGAGLAGFVRAEVHRARGRIDPDAAAALVEAIGPDLRGLAAAADQLASDFPTEQLTVELVGRYFSGRADVRGYQIADLALAGRAAAALEQLRWALATGVSGPAVTGSFAASVRGLARVKGARPGVRDADLAKEAGVPPFKVGQLRQQARGWEEAALARVIQAVARADAEVKGAGADDAYALERMVIAIATARA